METYKASLDKTAKVITAFVFLLPIGEIVVALTIPIWFARVIVIIIPVIIITFTYIYSVRRYIITDDSLIIKRPLSRLNKVIPLSEIESVSLLTKEDFRGTIRTFGDGGVFGYYGSFFNKKLRGFKMYATNRQNGILIILKNAKGEIVISPDDAGMLDSLQKRLNTRV